MWHCYGDGFRSSFANAALSAMSTLLKARGYFIMALAIFSAAAGYFWPVYSFLQFFIDAFIAVQGYAIVRDVRAKMLLASREN